MNDFARLDNEELLRRFLLSLQQESTKSTYSGILGIFERWAEKRPFASLTAFDMTEFSLWVESLGFSDSNRNKYYCTLRKFYGWLTKVGKLYDDNPTNNVFPPVKLDEFGKIADRILDIEEIDRILDECESDPRDYAMLMILATTGCRINELVNVKWSDFKEVPSFRGKGRHTVMFVTRKGGAKQGLPLRGETLEAIDAYRSSLRRTVDSDDYVFAVQYRGQFKPITTEGARRIVHKMAQQAGLEIQVTPHFFRHTCATYLLNNGVPQHEVQALLGHRSYKTTQKYIHVGMLEGITEKLPIRKRGSAASAGDKKAIRRIRLKLVG